MGSHSSGDEVLSSLLRRSHISSGSYDHDRRFDTRNSEDVHNDALAAALAEHERIRQIAVRAIELSEAREETEKLRQHASQEEERVRIETERAQEQCRLRDIENKARSIPKPAPRVPTPPPVQTPEPASAPPPQPAQQPTPPPQPPQPPSQPSQPSTTPKQPPPFNPFAQAPQQPQPPNPPVQPPPFNPFAQAQPQAQQQKPSFQPPPPPQAQQPAPPVQPPQPVPQTRTPSPDSHMLPAAKRYAEIHQSLKQLRASIQQEMKTNQALKGVTGNMRRRVTAIVGQLTIGVGVNKGPTDSLIEKLKEAFSVPCQGVDPTVFMIKRPQPVNGAVHNGDTLPSLYIYLLNIFVKGVVKQLASEQAADMYGVLVATIFASNDFKWRDESLIDILMAKMWKACPVLFGARGSEKTEEGRARLGWKKDLDTWVTDQEHNIRMTGLGAGYAAISLRNFGRSRLKNPYPPYHYWQTIATIVSTPAEAASPTQYNVLKSMIDGFEGRFIGFYGSAGVAALRVALIDFPARALDQTDPAVMSLKVIADKLERDDGLVLR